MNLHTLYLILKEKYVPGYHYDLRKYKKEIANAKWTDEGWCDEGFFTFRYDNRWHKEELHTLIIPRLKDIKRLIK